MTMERELDHRAAFAPATALFRGLGDPARLTVLWHLTSGERRVVDLVEDLGLAQSTVSAHLACLVGCGLVVRRAEGRSSVYSLAEPGPTTALLRAAERLLAATGEAVSLCPVQNDGSGRHRAGAAFGPGGRLV